MTKQIIFSILALAIVFQASAQDKIVLKQKGGIIEGEITQLIIGHKATIQTEDGTSIIIPNSQIKAIYDDEILIYGKDKIVTKEAALDRNKTWLFNWENKAMVNGSFGGLGVSIGALYQWKPRILFGGGVGYDAYNTQRERAMVPVFIQGRYYVRDWVTTPYLDAKAGYGVGLPSDNVVTHTGGMMANVGGGIKFGRKFLTTIGLGIAFQKAYHEVINPWNGGRSSEDRLYRRLTLNLGFMF